MYGRSSPTYAGAATQIFTLFGSLPAASAAARTALMVHSAMLKSASCKMKPSATSPVSASAFGPYAATHTSSSLFDAHGKRMLEPL